MNDSIIRFQHNPALTDTVGFFDYCIPLTNESRPPLADSMQKYYDFSIYHYITPLPPPRKLLQTTSVFRPHNLTPRHHGPVGISRQSADWIAIIFMACLFIFAWIQKSYGKRLSQIFRAVAQPHYVNQLEREGNLFSERITPGLGFIYYTVSSIFVFLLLQKFAIIPAGLSNMAFTGIIFCGLFLFHMLKSAVIYLTGIIFNTREAARQYQLNILIFNHITGYVLFPVTVIAFYWNSEVILTFGIIIVSILIVYRLFRGILTGLNNRSYNLFYLFLYLCTLEILPLLILLKVISKI